MNFPCKNCIVDAICTKPCNDFIDYLVLSRKLVIEYSITSARLKRFSKLIYITPLYFHYYTIAYKKFMENKK